MDKNAIKKYAVWARRELISRVDVYKRQHQKFLIAFLLSRLGTCSFFDGMNMKPIQLLLCLMPRIEGFFKASGIQPPILVDDKMCIRDRSSSTLLCTQNPESST